MLEDGSVAEDAGEDDEDGAAAPGSDAAPGQVAPVEPVVDVEAMSRRLADLIKKGMAAALTSPTVGMAIKTLAPEVAAAIKRVDPDTGALLDKLEAAIMGTAAQATPAVPLASITKSKQVWGATLKKIDDDVAKAKASILGAVGGTDLVAMLEDAFTRNVEPSLAVLDGSLSDKLDELAAATEPGAHAKALNEARAIIKSFQQHVAADPVIAQIDSNPFAPVAIGKILNASLTALASTIQ